MRSFEGQFSDNRPLKRTREEKVRQLRELKETLAGMRQHSSPALRTSIAAKIKELEAELAAPPPPPRERRPYEGYGPRRAEGALTGGSPRRMRPQTEG